MSADQIALSDADGVVVTLCGNVLSVTMNRPESINSLNEAMLGRIADAMEAAATDTRVKVVRLRGAGRGFSSGAGIAAADRAGDGLIAPSIIDQANRAVRAIVAVPCPVVAIVSGPAAGVAVSLALASDVVLAAESAFLVLAFTKIGLMPDGGASALVAAAVGRTRAMRMALLAERVPARDALGWGLVSAVYPDETFDAEVDAVVACLAVGPRNAYTETKRAVNAATLADLEPALELERRGQTSLLASRDFLEGAAAFEERRVPTFSD